MPILVCFLAQHFRKGVLQNMINNDHVKHEDLLHARAREVAFSFSYQNHFEHHLAHNLSSHKGVS